MDRNELIACFQDTRKRAAQGTLAQLTEKAVKSSVVYPENFTSGRLYAVAEPVIRVVEGTSFAVARENLPYGTVAVLNFANPHYPGGGVAGGAMAQEECLCRSSNLYDCISSRKVSGEYYKYNQTVTDHYFSDRLIYTKQVTVFKDDSPVPQLLEEKDWFQVDVITCAAPYVAKKRYVNRAVLAELFRSRIRNILEAAIHNEAEVLILGAFGCGAFGNPPEVVAGAFREVLQEQRYRRAFRRIIFAIKSSVGGDPYTVCPNIAAFQMAFFGVSAELEKLRYVGGGKADPGSEDALMPGGRIRCRGSESREYHSWKEKNPYFGRQFSILGDSVSTLTGFNPRGHAVHYQGKTAEAAAVLEMKDTWWGKVIDFFGGELLVNDSWSGSWVSRPESRKDQYPSGCSDRRTENLHMGSVKPDVILVYMGINDWGNGVPIGPEGAVGLYNADTFFGLAYGLMLRKLQKNYPQAEIWCCTLCETVMSGKPDFRFPEAFGGISIREYNRAIENAALANECRVIDLHGMGIPCDTMDGTHPNAAGMDTLAMLMVRRMADETGAAMLDCELTHDFAGEICRRCGKRRPLVQKPEIPELKLRRKDDGVVLRFRGHQIVAGRSPDCDFKLSSGYTARYQATFLCREGRWYLKDNAAKNGTYVNGVRLDPEQDHLLQPNDVIGFARVEEVIFLS